eukprot:COSAG01_NODE_109_length_25925_cov_48.384961_11_plen_382_part_00
MRKIKAYHVVFNIKDDINKQAPKVFEDEHIDFKPHFNWNDGKVAVHNPEEDYPYVRSVINNEIPELNFQKDFNLEKESFYRTPNITLPQNKMALLKDKYKISVKRDMDKANYLITSDTYFKSLFHQQWDSYSVYRDVKKHFNENKSFFKNYKVMEDFFDHIEENNEDLNDVYISIKLKCVWDIRSNMNKSLKSMAGGEGLQLNDICYMKDEGMIDIFNSHTKLVSDDYMLAKCNEDSVILSPLDLKNISQMLKSGDRESGTLALEIMANCNIEKSYDKIALMFAFYPDYMKVCGNWNSVNVKSMRKRFSGIDEISFHYTYGFEKLLKNLYKNNSLTSFAQKIILKKIYNTTLTRIGLTREASIFDFKLEDLKIKELGEVEF